MYLAFALISFTAVPLHKIGIGSGPKGISIFLMMVYFVINWHYLLRSISRHFIIQIIIIILLLVISFCRGVVEYNNTSGFSFSCSMWGSYIMTIGALYIFFKKATPQKVLKGLKAIFFSFKLSLLLGLLELIYFHIINSPIIKSLILLFIRSDQYFGQQKVQFSFGEPSECWLVFCLFLPTLYLLFLMGYHFSRVDKISVVLLLLMTLFFSASGTVVLCAFILPVTVFLVNRVRKNSMSVVKVVVVSLTAIFLILFSWSTIKKVTNGTDNRIIMLVNNPMNAFRHDPSAAVRAGLWLISIDIYVTNPIVGVGLGYFGHHFNKHVKQLDAVFMTDEMQGKRGDFQQQTYSIYSTAMVEGGLMGIIWLVCFLSSLNYRSKRGMYFLPLFLFCLLQNMMIYLPSVCLIAFLLSKHDVFDGIENGKYKIS